METHGTPYLLYDMYSDCYYFFLLYAVVTSLYTVTYSLFSVPSPLYVVLIQLHAVAFSFYAVHVVL